MANIPPKYRQSTLPPERPPYKNPNQYHTKYNGTRRNDRRPPTFTSFLKLNSNPRANNKNITPISDHVWILATSMTDGVRGTWGLLLKKAGYDIAENKRLL